MADGVADETDRLQPGKYHVYNVLCVCCRWQTKIGKILCNSANAET